MAYHLITSRSVQREILEIYMTEMVSRVQCQSSAHNLLDPFFILCRSQRGPSAWLPADADVDDLAFVNLADRPNT